MKKNEEVNYFKNRFVNRGGLIFITGIIIWSLFVIVWGTVYEGATPPWIIWVGALWAHYLVIDLMVTAEETKDFVSCAWLMWIHMALFEGFAYDTYILGHPWIPVATAKVGILIIFVPLILTGDVSEVTVRRAKGHK